MVKFSQLVDPIFTILLPKRRATLLGICALTVCMGLIEMGVAGSVSLLGVAMSSPEALSKFPGYAYVMSFRLHMLGEIPPRFYMLIVVMSVVCISIIFKNLLLSFLSWKQNCIANDMSWDCMCELYRHYLCASYMWHIKQNSADLQLYITWKYNVSLYVLNSVQMVANGIIVVILLSLTCFFIGYPALIVFATIGVAGVVVYQLFRMLSQSLGRKVSSSEVKLFRSTSDALNGIKEVFLYGLEQPFFSMMQNMQSSYVRIASARDLMGGVPQWILESLGIFILLIVLILSVLSGSSEVKVVGTLTLLAAVCWRLLPAVNKLLGSMLVLRAYLPNFQKILEKMQEITCGETLGKREFVPFRTVVSMHSVNFSYPETNEPALQNVSLTIPHGSMVGFIGASGAGKSTLAGVLSGLLKPDSGEIRADGFPLTQSHSLRIGYVPQHLYMLDATLAENVAFSEWGRPIDRKRVQECCKMACLDFVEDLPLGIDNPIGEKGVRLSGGQIQRVAIARALYSNPDLLIFDEATSALDMATEAAVQKTIAGLRKHLTIVIIAHRLTTVEDCDSLFWIDGGCVRMEGSASNVLKTYKQFLESNQ